jgi:hypothetical protein
MPTANKLTCVGLATLALCASTASRSEDSTLKPFTAVYALDWHNLPAGYSTLELKAADSGTYVYRSTNRARGVVKLAFPDAITQTSTFKIINGDIAPLEYQEDNPGKPNDAVKLQFDWSAGRVTGTANGKVVNQPLKSGTQDPLSVQIDLMRDLAAGSAPSSFLLFDKTEATEYHYTRERTEALETPLGHLDTIVYRSDRPGSDRVTRLWLAPSLGYVPVQAERTRGGSVDISLHIRELQRPAN